MWRNLREKLDQNDRALNPILKCIFWRIYATGLASTHYLSLKKLFDCLFHVRPSDFAVYSSLDMSSGALMI